MSWDAMLAFEELGDEWKETEWSSVRPTDWERCGLCGRRAGFNQGGSDVGMVCDDCAVIDGCERRTDEAAKHGPGVHISHWGIRHTEDEHADKQSLQERRRKAYIHKLTSEPESVSGA